MTTIAQLAQTIATRYGITDGPAFLDIGGLIDCDAAPGDTILSAEQVASVEAFFADAYAEVTE